MKKFIFLVTLFFTLCIFSSCKDNGLTGSFNKVDSHICGVYIELIDDPTFRVGGNNPSIYYSHSKSVLMYNNGSVNVQYVNNSKNIVEENGALNILLNTNIIFPSQAEDNINIYIIKENKDGSVYVDKSLTDVLNLKKANTYVIDYKYSIDKQNYKFQFTIGYSRKGA